MLDIGGASTGSFFYSTIKNQKSSNPTHMGFRHLTFVRLRERKGACVTVMVEV